MVGTVRAFTEFGYAQLRKIAWTKPEVIITASPDGLRQELELTAEGTDTPLFSPNREFTPNHAPLRTILNTAVKGPSRDGEHARLIHLAFPDLAATDVADQRVVAVLNCFLLGDYINRRWPANWPSESDQADRRLVNHVRNHWIDDRRGLNAMRDSGLGRLWWLQELARRSQRHSAHDSDTLLQTMSRRAGLYNQMVARPYLVALDSLRAAILDSAIETGGISDYGINRLMMELNLHAGSYSLDLMDRDEVRSLVNRIRSGWSLMRA